MTMMMTFYIKRNQSLLKETCGKKIVNKLTRQKFMKRNEIFCKNVVWKTEFQQATIIGFILNDKRYEHFIKSCDEKALTIQIKELSKY